MAAFLFLDLGLTKKARDVNPTRGLTEYSNLVIFLQWNI